MAKRKITVTVDEELVAQAQELGDSHLSAVVNAALEQHVERLARRAALGALLDRWDEEHGPVPDEYTTMAKDAFAELDAAVDSRGAA